MASDLMFPLRRSVEMARDDPATAKEAFHVAAVQADAVARPQCERCGRRHRVPNACQGTAEYRERRRLYHQTPAAKARRREYAKHPTSAMVAARLKQREKEMGYSITVEERDERLDEQGHRCAICRRPFRAPAWHLVCTFAGKLLGRRVPRVLVDHDHDTGATRGLLCNWCNRTIMPLFDRYPDRMAAARRYKAAGGWETE